MIKNKTIFASYLAFFISLVVLATKYYGYLETHSVAVLSDALESIVNVLSALFALTVMRAVSSPADEEHPYGHGKLEFFSSAFEGGLIAFASVAIFYSATKSVVEGSQLQEISKGFFYLSAATLINLLLAFYLKRVAKQAKSEALAASSAHLFSDVWTTVGALIGLFMVERTGVTWIDPFIAYLVSAHLGYSGYVIVRKAVGGLLDEMDPKSIQRIADAFMKIRKPGLIDLHNIKLIRSGNFHHIDGHIVVPEFWDIQHCHEEINKFEKLVLKDYGSDGEVALHLDPCHRHFCSRCDFPQCPIRQREFKKLLPLDYKHLIQGPSYDEPP